MPGLPVYQDSASQLKTQIYVLDDSDNIKGLVSDAEGRLIISTDAASPIDIEATDLDIRNLTNLSDSVAVYGNDGTDNKVLLTDDTGRLIITTDGVTPIDVEATDLDIRDLTNVSDSIAVYGNDGTDNVVLLTDAAGKLQANANHIFTNTDLGTVTTADAYAFSAAQDISNENSYAFFVNNTSDTISATLKVQLSPNNTVWVDDGDEVPLVGVGATILTSNKYLKYIRIGYKSTVAASPASLDIIFQSQS